MPSKATKIDLDIAARFRMVREFLDLSGSQMGEVCGLDQSMISYIESGKRELPTHSIKKLYLKHGISPLYLVSNILPMVYQKKTDLSIEDQVNELRVEVELMKINLAQTATKT